MRCVTMSSTTTQSPNLTPTKQTYQPVRKVTAGFITGSFVTLTVLILNAYHPFFKQDNNEITGDMTGTATTILTLIVSYLIPPGKHENSCSRRRKY